MITVTVPAPAMMTRAELEWLEAELRRRLAEEFKRRADEWGERLIEGVHHERQSDLFG